MFAEVSPTTSTEVHPYQPMSQVAEMSNLSLLHDTSNISDVLQSVNGDIYGYPTQYPTSYPTASTPSPCMECKEKDEINEELKMQVQHLQALLDEKCNTGIKIFNVECIVGGISYKSRLLCLRKETFSGTCFTRPFVSPESFLAITTYYHICSCYGPYSC